MGKTDSETGSSSSENEESPRRTPRKNPNPSHRRITGFRRSRSPSPPESNVGEGRNVRRRLNLENVPQTDEEFDVWFHRFMDIVAETNQKEKSPEPVLPIEWKEYEGKVETLDDLIRLGKEYEPDSLVRYYFPQERLHKLVEPLEELNAMIGMKKLKQTLLNHILFFCQDLEKRSPHMMHTVIHGPPGSGKTCVANILAKIYARMGFLKKEKVHSVRRSDLIGQYLGQTAVKTQKAIDEAKGGILLIDEAYSLGNPEGRDIYSKECIDTLCQNLSEGKGEFICVIIGYKESLEKCFFAYNPGLERRFPYRYSMDEYDAPDLMKILQKMVREAKWEWAEEMAGEKGQQKMLDFLEANRHYFKFNGGDLETFVQMLKLAHGKRVFGLNPKHYRYFTWCDWESAFELFLRNDDVKKRLDEELSPSILASMYS
jgi:hypothetical protein